MSKVKLPEDERSILLALRELEFTGCLHATELGIPANPRMEWSDFGVPDFLLTAWMHPLSKDSTEFRNSLRRLTRRKLVEIDHRKVWPYPLPLRLTHSDGRTILLFVEKLRGPDILLSNKVGKLKMQGSDRTGIAWGTYIGKQDGTKLYNVGESHGWCDPDQGFRVYNLTARGLNTADHIAAPFQFRHSIESRRAPALKIATLHALDPESIRVLRYVVLSMKLCTIDDIESGAVVSRPTAVKRTNELIVVGLLERPRGPKGGAGATGQGIEYLRKLDGKPSK